MVGTPAGHGDTFVADQPHERGRLHVPARQDQVGTGEQAGISQTPRVGVEHRHDGKHPVPFGDSEGTPAAGGLTLIERWPVR
jgi:hypothetical protein